MTGSPARPNACVECRNLSDLAMTAQRGMGFKNGQGSIVVEQNNYGHMHQWQRSVNSGIAGSYTVLPGLPACQIACVRSGNVSNLGLGHRRGIIIDKTDVTGDE